jgi:acetyl-CoA acyltransferase
MTDPRDAVVVDSVRTPMCKSYRGSFRSARPDDLLAHTISAIVARNEALAPDDVQDVVIGCAFPEGAQGFNISRNAAAIAGLPVSVPGAVINRFCSSGSQAIASAAQQIHHEGMDIVISGGVESISLVQDDTMNTARRFNPVLQQRKPEIYLAMGNTAEIVAARYGVNRQDQDELALVSQQRVAAAQKNGVFDDEIVSTPAFGLETEEVVAVDECNRPDTTLDSLAALKPAFTEGGTVTAGNASQLSDGASATLLMSRRRANELGITPLGCYRGMAVAGCEPDEMGIGPIYAIPLLLKRFGLSVGDIDLWELNEAFASQVLHVERVIGIPRDRMNVNGGAIAIGHPFGMTGSRLTGHILRELRRRGGRFGVVTMCVGSGMGFASLFELDD